MKIWFKKLSEAWRAYLEKGSDWYTMVCSVLKWIKTKIGYVSLYK